MKIFGKTMGGAPRNAFASKHPRPLNSIVRRVFLIKTKLHQLLIDFLVTIFVRKTSSHGMGWTLSAQTSPMRLCLQECLINDVVLKLSFAFKSLFLFDFDHKCFSFCFLSILPNKVLLNFSFLKILSLNVLQKKIVSFLKRFFCWW